MIANVFILYIRGLQTTARGPDAAREAIWSMMKNNTVLAIKLLIW